MNDNIYDCEINNAAAPRQIACFLRWMESLDT